MELRPYGHKDKPILGAMLDAEGVKYPDWEFERNETTVMVERGKPVGFFSIRMEFSVPYLVHFCVSREKRSPRRFFRLVRAFNARLREMKATDYIVNCWVKDHRTARLISSYCKASPYGVADGQYYIHVTRVRP